MQYNDLKQAKDNFMTIRNHPKMPHAIISEVSIRAAIMYAVRSMRDDERKRNGSEISDN